MDSAIKVRRSRTNTNQSITVFITFEICKQAKFGQGLFVCGNLEQLGCWDPLNALRLQWTQGYVWRGILAIPKDVCKLLEFKFIISEWDMKTGSFIEWEQGANRTIDLKLLQSQSSYCAEWNRQQVNLCLRIHSKNQQNNLYYVTGNIEELGMWKEKKMMHPIELAFQNKVVTLIKGDPESLSEPESSSFQVINFSVPRNLDKFNYYYCRWGETAETQSFPGRSIQLYEKVVDQEGRIADLQYLGQRIVIDQSSFDDLVLQKLTNQIYIGSCLKNSSQFSKLAEKNITAIIHLQGVQESCSINSSRVKSICKENGVYFKNWVVENLRNCKFIDEAQQIIAFIQNLIIQGHRVCLHCSRKILREGPIKILYLTLLGGHTFMQAMEQVRKQVPLSENSCKVAEDVLQLVSQKINRCRFAVQQIN